jgi:hypothetical protein
MLSLTAFVVVFRLARGQNGKGSILHHGRNIHDSVVVLFELRNLGNSAPVAVHFSLSHVLAFGHFINVNGLI